MDPTFWHERWATRQIGFHQADVHALLAAHWPHIRGTAADATPGGVFVPLCGKSNDMTWLRSQGHPVVGVELSPFAVAEYFAEAGLTPERTPAGTLDRSAADGVTLYAGDFFATTPAEVADCRFIYDRAALVALPPDMRRDYVAHLRRLFPQGARMLLVAFDYPQAQMDGPPFSVPDAEVQEHFPNAELLQELDALDQSPNLRQRGVTRLTERAYLVEIPASTAGKITP